MGVALGIALFLARALEKDEVGDAIHLGILQALSRTIPALGCGPLVVPPNPGYSRLPTTGRRFSYSAARC